VRYTPATPRHPPLATHLHPLRRPNILPHPLDPVPQLVHTRIPILQPDPHVIDLLHIQHLRLHPVDPRHCRHLIDTPPQQPQTQRLHDQDLNLLHLHPCLLADRLERHCPIVRRPPKDRLRQRRQRDFLPEEGLVGLEEGFFGEVRLECGVGG
jgi:hypothetical protein